MALDAHTNEIDDLAGQLAAAYRSNKPVARLTTSHPSLTVEQAYAVQLRQVEKWTTAGRRVCGHKVGLTAAIMQRQFGVEQPDFGHLTDDMFYPESTPIRPDAFLSPRVEPEIAFLLGKDLRGPGVTTARAIQAVDAVLPALEIIDSRIENWDITLADTIADNASSGGVVLGSRAIALRDVDTRLTGCVLYRDGAIAATGAGAAALGSPLKLWSGWPTRWVRWVPHWKRAAWCCPDRLRRRSPSDRASRVVADNASSARLILGATHTDPDDLDLALEACVLQVNGSVEATATGAAVQGHPAEALALAANSLAERGIRLEAGWIVLTGGMTDAVFVHPGDQITAEFTHLGTITVGAI